MSLSQMDAGIVTVLSSTSSLFTLFLAALFPSNNGDNFTLSKLVAVTISFLGLVSTLNWTYAHFSNVKQFKSN